MDMSSTMIMPSISEWVEGEFPVSELRLVSAVRLVLSIGATNMMIDKSIVQLLSDNLLLTTRFFHSY